MTKSYININRNQIFSSKVFLIIFKETLKILFIFLSKVVFNINHLL